MSNNQMVLAPRELLERLDLGKNTAVDMAALPELRELLAKPAEQHQGVPVAVVDEADDGLFVELIYGDNGNPLRRGDKLYTRPAQGEVVGWQFYQQSKWWNGDDRIKDHRKNTEAAGIPTRDVYTHADPAEVERLRTVIEQQKNLIESLRAELVESHSIDASAEPCATKCKHPVKCARFDNGEIVDHICQDCLQVFKPSAPVEINERAAFERRFPDFDHTLCSHEDWKDQYDDPQLGDMWNGWQARAALERKP
ncbi:hypothetical protein [Pseudomonas sp. EZ-C24]|uniref:hypothetical protein n=1 Tax=Pseudomonas sp. EZ-C24 TaxID=2753617 RepID=UPI00165D8DAB|nr:hypothetical protein [Pseudomonas sp. EZ-C24]